jgi:WD40 repeat protein
MPKLSRRLKNTAPVFVKSFEATIPGYPIAAEWGLEGKLLVIGDAEGAILALTSYSGEKIWEEKTAHQRGILDLAVNPSGNLLATVGQDGYMGIWELQTGELIKHIYIAESWIEQVAWSPNGERIALISGRVVRIFSKGGECLWVSNKHPSTVSAIVWSNDQELATSCYGQVVFFNTLTGKENQRLEWKGSLISLAVSPNKNIVACGSQDNSVHFWRRSTGQDSMMSGYPSKPSSLAFSRDGLLLATNGGEVITVWSFEGNGPEDTRPAVLEVHKDLVTSLRFSAEGYRLITGSKDGIVAIWDLTSKARGKIMGKTRVSGAIEKIYFRPDDRGAIALDASGLVTSWHLKASHEY